MSSLFLKCKVCQGQIKGGFLQAQAKIANRQLFILLE